MQLPTQLLASLADSECELVQWDGLQRTATVRIVKDALPETGLLHFTGVTYVCFPHRLTLDTIATYTQETVSQGINPLNLAERITSDEAAAVFYDTWQQDHGCIIARTCDYQIQSQPPENTSNIDLTYPLALSIEPMNVIALWKVLNVLTVSLDRLGSYQLKHGESAAKDALHQFFQPALFQEIAHTRRILTSILDEQLPGLSAYLEETPDDVLGLHYWNGPQVNQ